MTCMIIMVYYVTEFDIVIQGMRMYAPSLSDDSVLLTRRLTTWRLIIVFKENIGV